MPIIGSNWVFIHNPKAAGKTISKALSGHEAPPKHAPAFMFPGGGFTFGIVRNPWDRLLSLYTFLCEQSFGWYDATALQLQGFNDWVLGCELQNPGDYNWPAPLGAPGLQRRPQTWWLDGCDYVGRFEHLQRDFFHICTAIGARPTHLPKTNTSGHLPYQQVYTPEAAAAVQHWFSPDIQRWGYTFQ